MSVLWPLWRQPVSVRNKDFSLVLWTRTSILLQELLTAEDDWRSTWVHDIHPEPTLSTVPTHPAGLTVECHCSVSVAYKSPASNLHLESAMADFRGREKRKSHKVILPCELCHRVSPTVQMSTQKILLGWQTVSPRQLSSCQTCLQPWHGEISFHLTYTPR